MTKGNGIVELGDRVKDVVTGFVGITMGRSEFINKCERFGVQKEKIDKAKGKPDDLVWFDLEQLEVVDKAVIKIDKRPLAERPNGPGLDGERRADAPR